MTTLCLNATNGAVTTFELPACTSFAVLGGRVFATGPAGLIELTGDTDAGTAIAARVLLGNADFGDSHQKRIGEVYLDALAAPGALNFEVVAEGEPYRYTAEARSERGPHKAKTGRGLRSRRYQPGFSNNDGQDFTVLGLALLITAEGRRV